MNMRSMHVHLYCVQDIVVYWVYSGIVHVENAGKENSSAVCNSLASFGWLGTSRSKLVHSVLQDT